MVTTAGRPQVFLTRSYPDPTADSVTRTLNDGGCVVVPPRSARRASVASRMDAIGVGMDVADAMVVVASAETAGSPWTPFEMGAAMATGKPIFVVPVASGLVPTYMHQGEVVAASAVDTLLPRLRGSAAPLGEREVAALIDLYSRFGVPVEELVADPVALRRLAGLATRVRQPKLQPDRLARELVRLGESGLLPPSPRRRRSPVVARSA